MKPTDDDADNDKRDDLIHREISPQKAQGAHGIIDRPKGAAESDLSKIPQENGDGEGQYEGDQLHLTDNSSDRHPIDQNTEEKEGRH